MADIFGDAELFTEFDKQRPPSDTIWKQKLGDEFWTHRTVELSNGNRLVGESEEREENDVAHCEVTDAGESGENTSFVHSSKLKHLEKEVHHLTVLNIFFDTDRNAAVTWFILQTRQYQALS